MPRIVDTLSGFEAFARKAGLENPMTREVLWKDAALLFAWGIAILTLATLRSRKRLASGAERARPTCRRREERLWARSSVSTSERPIPASP